MRNMFAVAALLIATSLQGNNELEGYAKGDKVFSGSVTIGAPETKTGVKGDDITMYVVHIEGTSSSGMGRACDGFYTFTDPYWTFGLPTKHMGVELLIGSDPVYRPFEIYHLSGRSDYPAFQGSHSYDFLWRPRAGDEISVVSPATKWTSPSDDPLNGTYTMSIYKAVQDTGERATFDAIDPQRFYDINSADSLTLPMKANLRPGLVDRMVQNMPAPAIKGVACDGASLVLLRVAAPSDGKVKFAISSGSGALYPIVGNPFIANGSPSVEAQTVDDPRKKKLHYAFALYRPPSYYSSTLDPNVGVSFSFSPASGSGVPGGDLKLHLVRPPIVLVHGTYDDPVACWQTRDEADDSPVTMKQKLEMSGWEFVSCVDWESTNGNENPSNFKDNMYTVFRNKDGIQTVIAKMREEGYVATQADVVCHSQGGVITRVYARGYHLNNPLPAAHYTDPWKCEELGCFYHRAANYGMGDIHRLVTISTTNRGSDICRLFNGYEQVSQDGKSIAGAWLDMFRVGVHTFGSGLFTGGFEDQIPGSKALASIGPTPIPSHAIAGVCDDQTVQTAYGGFYASRMGKIWSACPISAMQDTFRKLGQFEDAAALKTKSFGPKEDLLNYFRECVFNHEENDCTVRISSSFGGLEPPYRTRVPNVLHGWEPRYRTMQTRVVDLLRGDGKDFDINGFPDSYVGTKASIGTQVVAVGWSGKPADITNVPNNPNTNSVPNSNPQGANNPAQQPQKTQAQSLNDAITALNNKDYAGAAGSLIGALIKRPSAGDPKAASAIGLYKQGKYAEAEPEAAEAVRLDPKNANHRVTHGTMLYMLARYPEAEQEYREATRLNPKYGDAHGSLALALMGQGRYAEAETSYREAVRLSPKNADWATGLGNSLGYQGKWADSEPWYRQAIKLNPNSLDGHAGLGSALAMKGQFVEAEVEIRKAIAMNTNLGMYHANLAIVLLRENKRDEALKEAYEAKRLGVKEHVVFKELGISGDAPSPHSAPLRFAQAGSSSLPRRGEGILAFAASWEFQFPSCP